MQHTPRAYGGMTVAPHHLAAQAGRDILAEGGNAIEAMVAMASTIAVAYPHMNGIGGDGFWLIHEPGKPPLAIDASGPAAGLASRSFYAEHGYGAQDGIPSRGPLAALTMAGTLGGWQLALDQAAAWGPALPLSRLLEAAIGHGRTGVAVTDSQAALSAKHLSALNAAPGFAETYLNAGQAPAVGSRLRQPRLADTLEHLTHAGLDDAYRGELAASMAADLEALGSPLRRDDFTRYHPRAVTPLEVRLKEAHVFNLPPPTQGLATLMTLGVFERLGVTEGEGVAHLHGLVEATKRAFMARDSTVTDPGRLPRDPQGWLTPEALEREAAQIDSRRALPWPHEPAAGDTIWMAAADGKGRMVSFIQSVYWEFGSGVVLPQSGVMWQNRGIGFSLDPQALQALEPYRQPFHTLNPSLARFDDGRVMSFGTMGGEGQPQTQAAIYSRYAHFGMDLQQAINAPRWLLGRTWGEESTGLKLENRFPAPLMEALENAGHEITLLDEGFSDTMGHAGAIVRHPDGLLEGAHDPRSDGGAAAV
ncbi:gamma-glutamyltransferase family protein [Halomonas salinarum]|uniref:gamma-glutamyltransferase family protein n=1 Tax=Halomonas salinarum TaxID=1158993 RepID=UPI001439B64C|nr:gamma-glutamyltransferase family protein [Halomonas salinarum]